MSEGVACTVTKAGAVRPSHLNASGPEKAPMMVVECCGEGYVGVRSLCLLLLESRGREDDKSGKW